MPPITTPEGLISAWAQAEIKPSGVVIGGTKLKVGVPVELEGRLYRLNGVVSGVMPL